MNIGVFDSGYGGLTILDSIRTVLPEYDYVYLGDNARTPYGTRSFEVVYQYTLECVRYLFEKEDCQLVILACNTASAKALRSIQQNDLPRLYPGHRVLGVIRPTVEAIGAITRSRHVGLVATEGTIRSCSYPLEVAKLFPDITIYGQACPMWVPLIEAGEHRTPGADFFVGKYLSQLYTRVPDIDTLILGCTHYPLLVDSVRRHSPPHVSILTQGDIVARSLADYLCRHPEFESLCSKHSSVRFLTTESEEKFSQSASLFLNTPVEARHVII